MPVQEQEPSAPSVDATHFRWPTVAVITQQREAFYNMIAVTALRSNSRQSVAQGCPSRRASLNRQWWQRHVSQNPRISKASAGTKEAT